VPLTVTPSSSHGRPRDRVGEITGSATAATLPGQGRLRAFPDGAGTTARDSIDP